MIRSLGSGSFVLRSGGRHLPTSLPTIWLLQNWFLRYSCKIAHSKRERERERFIPLGLSVDEGEVGRESERVARFIPLGLCGFSGSSILHSGRRDPFLQNGRSGSFISYAFLRYGYSGIGSYAILVKFLHSRRSLSGVFPQMCR